MEPLEERTLLDAASFVPVTGLPGTVNGAVAWGDIDNDGKLDVVIAGAAQFGSSAKGSTLIFHNNGDGTFEKLSVNLPSMKSAAVALADFDNDGRVDLLLSGLLGSTPTTSLYHNDGDHKFTAVTTTLPGLQDSAIACADYNLDGYLDILLAGTNSSGTIVTQLYTNLGSNTFSKNSATFTGVKAGSLAWGDYDSDTWPDLVLIGTTSSGTAVTALYNNNADGTFTVVSNSDLPKVQHGSVAWADYDLDDSPDLLFTGEIDGTVGTEIYHNNGNGTFANTVSLTGVKNGVGVWGDYDRDGLLDVLVTGESSSGVEAILFHNDSNDEFSDTEAGLTGVTNATASFADFNGDGLLDIFLTGKLQSNGSSTEYSGLLWQNVTDSEAAVYVEAPSSLTVKVNSESSVTLLWDPPVGSDGVTPPSGLTYSLRVGTTPGGCDIVSPWANSDGTRQVAQPGPININAATIEGLVPGQVYYFSVQAIDGALNNSEFAAESTFVLSVVTLTAPTISTTLTPAVTVTVSNPVTEVADGLAAIIDVDLNNDGDFNDTFNDGIRDWQETDFARAELTNGTVTFNLPTLGYDGDYGIRARVDGTDVNGDAIDGQKDNISASATQAMTIDATPPSVVVSVSPTQANPTATWPLYYKVAFSEAVTDFDASDITVGGTASGSFVSAVTASSSTTYVVEVTGMTSNGKVTISIAADKVHDAAGNGNKASTGSATVTYKAPTPTFYLTGPVYNTYQSGDIVTIDWRAKDVGYASTISLCYDEDATWWNGNEHWIEIGQVAAANGTASYAWNTQGIKPGTYYIAGYLWSGSQPTFSHLTRAITIQGNSTTFALTAPTSGTYSAGSNVSIQWAASNVGSGSKISLCYDVDTRFNGNEKWIEIDQVAAANGKGSYTWNTSGVAAGSYYVGGYLWSNGQPVLSWLNSRITITANSSVPKFALTSPQNTSVSAGTSVAINWTANNYAAGSVVSLCYDTDTLWNGNEKWIEIDKASAASGTYNWDTTNVLAGKYYVAGYLWSNSTATYSRLTGSVTVNVASATLSFTGPASGQYASGQELLIQWAAGSYYSGSKVSLYYDTDTALNGNEKWIEIDQAAAGDGEGGWFWKTEGLAAGTYYIGGYIYSQGKPTFARLANPITLQTTQTTFAFGYLGATSVTQGTLVSLAWNAGNVASGSTVGICLDSDSLWNGNETWIVNDTISAGNGLGGRDLDTSTLTPGTYYLGARLKSNGVYYYSHMTTTLTITASSSSGTSASVASLNSAALLDTSSWLDDDAADQLANSLLASNSSSATAKALASLI